MGALQSLYISILRPFERINNERNRKKRNGIIVCCFSLMILLIYLSYINHELLSENSVIFAIEALGNRGKAIIGSILLLVIIFASVEKGLRKVRWNWFVFTIWELFSIIVIISGLFHDIGNGYIIAQLAAMLLFPMLYYVWDCRGDIEVLYTMVSLVILVGIIVVSILLVLFQPFGENALPGDLRYAGFTRNPNTLALDGIVGVIASLYLCTVLKWPLKIISMIGAGLSLALLISTLSRTSIVACILLIVVWILLMIKQKRGFRTVLVSIVVAFVAFSGLYIALGRGSDAMHLYSKATEPISVYAEGETEETMEPSESDVQDEMPSESGELLVGRFENFENLNQFTSGRVGIWSLYFNYLNFTGNDVSYMLPLRVVQYDNQGYDYYRIAHNVPLEYAFRAGSPAGIVFLLIELCAIIAICGYLFSKDKERRKSIVFAALALLAFVVIGMFESIEMPFSRIPTLLFYIGFGSVLTLGKTKEDHE